MQQAKQKWFQQVKFDRPSAPHVLLLLLSALFLFASFRCFWADSEAWALKISGLQGEARQNFDYWIKPAFHVFLNPMFHLSQSLNVHHMTVGRWFFAVNGLFLVGFASWLLVQQTRAKSVGWLLATLGLSSWLFLEQGYRVRSDLLAMTVFLLHLGLTLKMYETGQTKLKSVALFYLLGLLAIAITPKIAIVYLAFLPLGWATFRRLKVQQGQNWFESVGLGILTLTTVWTLFDNRLFVSTVRQIRNLRSSIFDGDGSVGVFAFYRFEHLIRSAFENPHIAILIIIKSIWILRNRTLWRQSQLLSYLDLGVLLTLMGLLIFPDRMPWLIASYLPLVLIFSLHYPPDVVAKINSKLSQRQMLATVGGVLLLLMAIWKVTSLHLYHNSDEQRLLAVSMDEYQKIYPAVRVYDPSGMTRSLNNYHYYLGPGDIQVNYWSAELIKQSQPDIILSGQRLDWVKKLFGSEFLDAYWDPFRTGVYLRGREMPLPNQFQPSALKGYKRIEMTALVESVLQAAPHSEILHFQLSQWPQPPLGSIFFEFEGGRLHPVTRSGVPINLYRQAIGMHVPKESQKILIFRDPSFAFFQLSMPKLLRFDSEL